MIRTMLIAGVGGMIGTCLRFLVGKVSTALFKIPPAEHPKKEHKSKTGVDCFKMVLVSYDRL